MKGIGFENVRAFVRNNYGERRLSRMIDDMAPPDRAALGSVIAIGWYDVHLFARLLSKLDQTFGKGDHALLRSVGAFEAEQDFGRTLRWLIRGMAAPSLLADRRLWEHFQNSGSWSFCAIEGGARGILHGWAIDAALCEELCGYRLRLLELTGCKNVSVEHCECRAAGQHGCIFDFRWQ
jgi:hypothetical protein